MPYTLLIIDQQRKFSAACKYSTIQSCKFLIKNAINDEADIVYLEFVGFGRTNRTLTNLSDNYAYEYFIRKDSCSGAEEIKAVKNAYNLRTQHFKVCGVNTDQCVQHTVIDLAKLFPNSVIEVIANACNTINKVRQKDALEIMGSHKNIIVNTKSVYD